MQTTTGHNLLSSFHADAARQVTSHWQQHTNVGDAERWASVIGGGALALYGLTRGSLGGLALAALGSGFVCRGVTGHCSVYCAMGVNTAEHHGAQTSIPAGAGVKVEKSISINRPRQDLYRFWRNFENLSRFMSHLESVRITGDGKSHWVAKGPLGASAEWDAEVINERENELIAWRSLPGSTVDTAGSVHFIQGPGGHGTEVHVVLKYNPPAGKVGAAIARMFGESAEQQIEEDLRRFKQVMEAGEKARSESAAARAGNLSHGTTPTGAARDLVHEASELSFPASDAPSWTARK